MTGCLNGGLILPDENKHTFSCSFQVPWPGEKCETKVGKKMINCKYLLNILSDAMI